MVFTGSAPTHGGCAVMASPPEPLSEAASPVAPYIESSPSGPQQPASDAGSCTSVSRMRQPLGGQHSGGPQPAHAQHK